MLMPDICPDSLIRTHRTELPLKRDNMDNKNTRPAPTSEMADDKPKKRYAKQQMIADDKSKKKYTKQQIKDAEAFLDNLKKIPDEHYEAGRLLVLGFMTALDKKPE